MESFGDLERQRRVFQADPNFNLFSIGDGQREGSIALSDISFPSHVSELESFQSDLDISFQSRDSVSTRGELHHDTRSDSGVEPFTQHQGSVEGTKSSMSPDLPEQTSENINLLLAALKAATVQESGSDQGSNGSKSDTSSNIANQDSSLRFISKESFPESIFSENESSESVSWGKDASLNPEELVNQPSSTPFCGERLNAAVKQDSDSKMSERFWAPSSTPGPDPNNDFCPDSAAGRNPWSFSGNSILLQTTSAGDTFNQPEVEQSSSKPNITEHKGKDESSFSSPIQKQLWLDTPERTITAENAFQKKDSTSLGYESSTPKDVYNPFDDSDNVQATSSSALEDGQDLFEYAGFSFGQELQEDFSFQTTDDAAQRLNKDEEIFLASHVFDKDVLVGGDISMFSEGVLPHERTVTDRRSLLVVGVNDPNDKGELRISFGDFFAAKTEELGRLGDAGDEHRPRPCFSGTRVKVSPAAANPRPLYRPSLPEGSEEVTLPRQSSNTDLKSEQPKPRESGQGIVSQQDRKSSANYVKRSSPSGTEDKDENKARQKKESEKAEKEKEKKKQEEEEEEEEEEEQSEEEDQSDSGNRTRSAGSVDPNSSAIVALKFCHSSQGSKLLGMSTNELKSLSSTLAQVTQGDAREIYNVLVNFICEERRLSHETASDLNESSQRLSDVFYSQIKKTAGDGSTVIVDRMSIPEDPDEMTFYHSDTSCEVSPTASKFERLPPSSIPSPPLDSSSPKSTASSIAVQTESAGDYVAQTSITPCHHTATPSMVGPAGRSTTAGTYLAKAVTEQYGLVNPSARLPQGLTDVALQTSVLSTGVLPTTLSSVQRYPDATTSHTAGGSAMGLQGTVVTHNQARLPSTANWTSAAAMGRATKLVATHDQMNPAVMAGKLTYDTPSSTDGMVYLTPVGVAADVFTSEALPRNQALAMQSVPTVRTIPEGLAKFVDKPRAVSTSLHPHPRSAFDTHGFFASQAPGETLGSVAASGAGVGMYSTDPGVAQLGRVHAWGGGVSTNPVGHRKEVWNWRTERTSQIQMVIPPVLDFPGVLCVGMSENALLPIHNPTSRWIRCSSVIVLCTVNGVKVDHLRDCPFSIRETTLIGPKLTENVKVEFLCLVAGIYVAEMKVVSTPVGSMAGDSETSSALVTVQCFSEQPQLEILADDGQTLDFGELHHGCNGVRPLRIANKGRTAIPLKMLICSSSSPGLFVFSKNNSPDVIQNLQIKSTALKCLLPATNDLDLKSEPLTIWIEMNGKSHHCSEKSDHQAEMLIAGVNIQLDVRALPKILGNVPLKGIIGFTKIQIPKAFQMAMCLSSLVGQRVSRQLPFSNAGNISANVELTIPKYSDVFVATPDKFHVRPGTAVTVEVCFLPRVKGSYESVIQVSELGDSKCYEVLLRGSSVEPQPTIEDGHPILSNKSYLCWTGVDIGKAAHQRLFLLNDSSERSIHFQAVILGEHADFAIQRMRSDFPSGGNSSEPMSLRPKERIPIYVLFAPSSLGVFKSALVLKPNQGPRFQVPLYAYGGTSEILICNQSKTSDGYVADLGQISLGHRNILKITLKNSGTRAAFVKAVCYSDFQIRLLYPQTHLSIVPSQFILPERSSKELVIVFQPLQHDAKVCQSQVKRIATVMFYYGDEVLRQWYKRNLTKQQNYAGRKPSESSRLDDLRLDKVFEDENCVAEEFDYPAVENWSEVFDSHLSQVPLNLLGGPERQANGTSTAVDGVNTSVVTGSVTGSVTAVQRESVVEKNTAKENADNNKASAMWTIIPERLSLKVPVEGATDATKKVQLLNFSDRPLEFEFIWPGHCVAVTPHRGTIPPKNQTLVHVSVWASISSSGIELPWCGTAYVNCDGTKKELAIQIHRHLVCDGSPAPAVINKPLTVLDPEQDKSLLLHTYVKPQKRSHPLTITPKTMEFPETEVGKVSCHILSKPKDRIAKEQRKDAIYSILCNDCDQEYIASIVTLANVSTSSVRWKVSSVAPAYAKVSTTSADILRATYPVFRFSSRGGLMRPGQTVKIEVEFQTRDVGDYCQIWDVQTNPESPLTSTKIQMELSGKAVPQKTSSGVLAAKRSKGRLSDPVCERELVVTSSIPESRKVPSKQTTDTTTTTTTAKGNMNIYFESDNVQFPDTEVGSTSVVKVKICNRSSTGHEFRVVNPKPPFSVKCSNLFTKPTHYLRIPVYFSPNEPCKHYEETVAFSNAKSGALLSVKLQGNSLPAK